MTAVKVTSELDTYTLTVMFDRREGEMEFFGSLPGTAHAIGHFMAQLIEKIAGEIGEATQTEAVECEREIFKGIMHELEQRVVAESLSSILEEAIKKKMN